MDNHSNLINIYFFVCKTYEKDLKYCVQRFSNNSKPQFTDQEIMTVMLYCTAYEQRTTVRQVYDFTRHWLYSWFPLLPSYQAFNRRVNRLSEAFRRLFCLLIEEACDNTMGSDVSLVDSLPIITCSSKRQCKTALEVVDKGYCSTKSIYYYGVKLHFLSSYRKGALPVPKALVVTPASQSDLSVFRDNWSGLENQLVFADKAYQDKPMQKRMRSRGSELLSPVKYPRGACEAMCKFNKAADDLFSHAVSAVRQPIEAFFAWLLEKSDIQRASKIRSISGLLVHIFNKLSASFISKFNFKY